MNELAQMFVPRPAAFMGRRISSTTAQTNQVDREAVRTLAVAIGVREAARQLGLSEERVMKWSQRGHWLKAEAKPQPPTVTRNDVRTVRKPAEVLMYKLQEQSQNTRLGLSKAALKAARVFQKSDGEYVIGKAKAFRAITSAAGDIHRWQDEEKQGAATPPLRVYASNAIVNVKAT